MKQQALDYFLGNATTAFSFSNFRISIVSYTQNVSEDWHYHEKAHLSAILRGGNLESRKREDIQVTPNKVMVYEAGEVHRNRFTAHPSRNLNVEFEDDFFSDGLQFSNLHLDERVQLNFHRLYAELHLNDVYSEQAIEQALQALFWNDTPASSGPWVQEIRDLLHDRWDAFPSLQELSEALRVHPITISKYFPKHYGMTLSEYSRRLKVKRALDRLLNSSSSFAEIAYECGFSDQSHMTRLVRQHIGFTPGAIRSLQ